MEQANESAALPHLRRRRRLVLILSIGMVLFVLAIAAAWLLPNSSSNSRATKIALSAGKPRKSGGGVAPVQGLRGISEEDIRMFYEKTSMELTPESCYLATVTIGTPAQKFYLLVDTGSDALWVRGTEFTSSSLDVNTYMESVSSTSKSLKNPCYVDYAKGSVSGTWYNDTVTTASSSIAPYSFCRVVNASDDFNTFDGLIGFSFSARYPDYPIWYRSLAANGGLDDGVFSFVLSDNQLGESFMILGADDSYYVPSTLKYVDCVSSGNVHWRVNLRGVSAVYPNGDNGSNNVALINVNQNVSNSHSGILDTGSNFIYVSNAFFNNFVDTIQEQRPDCILYSPKFPALYCSNSGDGGLPDLHFVFDNNATVVVPPSMYKPSALIGIFPLDSQSVSENEILLGIPFLRSAHVLHDFKNARVGFAERNYPGITKKILIIIAVALSVVVGVFAISFTIVRSCMWMPVTQVVVAHQQGPYFRH